MSKSNQTTATSPQAADDHYRVAAALALNLGALQEENYTLKADRAHLKNAVEQLLDENERISRAFEIVLSELDKRGTIANG